MAPPRTPIRDRVLRRVEFTDDGCWTWAGNLSDHGYGRIRLDGGGPYAYVHRIVYELFVGAIPDGMTIDHLCRNRRCCNPDHLEAVTRGENVLRGIGPAAVHRRQTECVNGHAFDEINTYHWRGIRQCRTCRRAADKRRVR